MRGLTTLSRACVCARSPDNTILFVAHRDGEVVGWGKKDREKDKDRRRFPLSN